MWLIVVVGLVAIVFSTFVFLATRYKRCPSDKILVIYGKVADNRSARCMHGGGSLVLPLIQDYAYLSLTPMTISIPLQNALSLQNIRINVPSTFTVGISTDPKIMNNAAERLLNLSSSAMEDMAKEIIFGQLRLTVASLTIEQINQDRESFLESVRKNVEPELNKIGLYLINVNITDITDGSNYIESIGKKAASEAINRAKVDVAEQQKLGAIGESVANRERAIQVAKNLAEADKGEKESEADRRIFVQKKESLAVIGEAEANSEKTIQVAQKIAAAEMGEKNAEAERRVYVQKKEAEAIEGENTSKASIVISNSELMVKEAQAHKNAEIALREAQVEIQKAQYLAELERLKAEEIVKREIEKHKIELDAQAEAGKISIEAKGHADALLQNYQAEAEGVRKVLTAKAQGYSELLKSVNNDPKALATLLMVEKIESIVEKQVEAIKNIKIDKITVWDSNSGDGNSSTANFVSSFVKSLPPLQDVAGMAGVELPSYLGRMKDTEAQPETVRPVENRPVKK
ncbi:MAG TPA: SPFH domain-containing protein [Candidatus Rifleibacterium sp.]|nr:SPFH domain-containing protein [Candidatus Rifleibacterium sp.]HPT44291.1 SPFH domain-containing protein [Candidatus Rifleibacterium sp.]